MSFFKTKKGFTLIELMVVISIIVLISTAVLANMAGSRGKARDVMRRTALKQLEIALDLYYADYKRYPGPTNLDPLCAWNQNWCTSQNPLWISGLSPAYIPVLPRDPRQGQAYVPACASVTAQYLYKSLDNDNYALLAFCSPEGTWTSADPLYDSDRSNYAWRICRGPLGCGYGGQY